MQNVALSFQTVISGASLQLPSSRIATVPVSVCSSKLYTWRNSGHVTHITDVSRRWCRPCRTCFTVSSQSQDFRPGLACRALSRLGPFQALLLLFQFLILVIPGFFFYSRSKLPRRGNTGRCLGATLCQLAIHTAGPRLGESGQRTRTGTGLPRMRPERRTGRPTGHRRGGEQMARSRWNTPREKGG